MIPKPVKKQCNLVFSLVVNSQFTLNLSWFKVNMVGFDVII